MNAELIFDNQIFSVSLSNSKVFSPSVFFFFKETSRNIEYLQAQNECRHGLTNSIAFLFLKLSCNNLKAAFKKISYILISKLPLLA